MNLLVVVGVPALGLYLASLGELSRTLLAHAQRFQVRLAELYSDTWYEAVTQRDEMLRRWQEEMREGIEAVGADTPAGSRLEETRRFYKVLLDEMPRLMERWRKVRSESPAEERA